MDAEFLPLEGFMCIYPVSPQFVDVVPSEKRPKRKLGTIRTGLWNCPPMDDHNPCQTGYYDPLFVHSKPSFATDQGPREHRNIYNLTNQTFVHFRLHPTEPAVHKTSLQNGGLCEGESY